VLLDEPSAHLDEVSEAWLTQTIDALCQTRTVILVAHRLSTLHAVSHVAVLDHGQLVDYGPPSVLRQRAGLFSIWTKRGPLLQRRPCDETLGSPSMALSPRSRLSITVWHIYRGRQFRTYVDLSLPDSQGGAASPNHLATLGSHRWSSLFGTSRGVFRYGDRYFSHDVTFRLLKNIRLKIYQAIEPLSPIVLKRHLSGDLWTRFGADVETLQNAYLGLVTPILVAAGSLVIAAGVQWLVSPFGRTAARTVNNHWRWPAFSNG